MLDTLRTLADPAREPAARCFVRGLGIQVSMAAAGEGSVAASFKVGGPAPHPLTLFTRSDGRSGAASAASWARRP